jgi:hypothetical protein
MNTEERQLSEMLHRVTPEPPRSMTVEAVASRLSASRGRGRYRGRPGRTRGWGRWSPALAAASVIAVAGASAGVATALSSHHGRPTAPGSASPSASTSFLPSQSVSPAVSPQTPPAGPTWPPKRVAGGMWGADLINRQVFQQNSLVAGFDSLYAIGAADLDRIDPSTGRVLAKTPYQAPVQNPPVVTGSTVWILAAYSTGGIVLHGYDGKTLAQVASVTVPVTGQLSASPQGVLTSGPDGDLYLAAGDGVAVVNPETRQVDRRISVPAGSVGSVAVSPDGNRLYVSVGSLEILTYNPATGARLASSTLPGLTSTAGNLVATSGGVWGTAGVGMSEWGWFAPDADLTRMVRVGQGAGGGLASIPAFSGGSVWIGGSHNLVCADPATGQVQASATIPTDNGVVEYFSSVAVVGGRGYALYLDQAAHGSLRTGVVTLTPPAACGG